MNKTIIFIRHAEAVHGINQRDLDRHLSPKGRRDAAKMASFLKEKNIIPELILSSPATRTKETAEIFTDVLFVSHDLIEYKEMIYHGSETELNEALRYSGIQDEIKTVFLIAHNPGISDFLMPFADESDFDYFSPGAILGVEAQFDSWSEFSIENSKLLFFRAP